jgi:hypothetical protein
MVFPRKLIHLGVLASTELDSAQLSLLALSYLDSEIMQTVSPFVGKLIQNGNKTRNVLHWR